MDKVTVNTNKITRLTVVDDTGRVYERYGVELELSIQDGGRTLKVFVHPMKNLRDVLAEMEAETNGWPPMP